MNRARLFAVAARLAPALLLAACAHAPVLDAYLPTAAAPVVLSATPFYPQERYQCGPAALAMGLTASGVEITPQALVPKLWIPQLEGSLQAEMIAAARSYGRVPYVIAPGMAALLAELRAQRPVLVLLNLGWRFYPVWHYAVVIGYLPDQDALLLRSGRKRRKRVDAENFLDDWTKAEQWGLVVLRPGELPAGDDESRYLAAVVGLEQEGRAQAAERAYAAATERWPQAAAAWLGLGNARYAQGDAAGAEAAYRDLLARRPGLAVARNNLAQVLAERGCIAAALDQIKKAVATAPPALGDDLQQTRAEIAAMPAGGAHCAGD